MKNYYQEQLDRENVELEYLTIGVVAKADKLISDCADNTATTPLSLEDVCALTDSLNALLKIVYNKRTTVARTETLLDEYSAKSGEAGDDENHE